MTFAGLLAMSGVLIGLSAVHLRWAPGWWRPIADETGLARAVVGRRGVTCIPGPVACASVAVGVFSAARLPHLDLGPGKPGWMIGLGAVWGLGGAAAWMPVWRNERCPKRPLRRWINGCAGRSARALVQDL